jgi:hypothetical protein
MRRALAGLITVVIGAATLWAGLRRDNRSGRVTGELEHPPSPHAGVARSEAAVRPPGIAGATERIEALLECARRGDVAGYLNSFGGTVRARLEQQVAERGLEVFAAELRRFGELKKSHAVFAPEPDGADSETVRVGVETTFADRIERQTYCLKLCDAGWFVTEVERARDQVPENPVGSPATFHEPEGVPVPLKDEG